MSYNVDHCKVKKLENLRVPLSVLKAMDVNRYGEHLLVHEIGDDTWSYNDNGEGLSMSGTIMNDEARIRELIIFGEGSGHQFTDLLLPMLKQSKGIFEAVLIWEGGDSINRVKSLDGVVTTEDVDL